MPRHSDYALPNVIEAGRRGGSTRSRSLTPERKREIACRAGSSAAFKRANGISHRELIDRIASKLSAAGSPELGAVVQAGFRMPEMYATRLAWCLSPAEVQTITAAVAAATAGTEREQKALQEVAE